MSTLAEILSAFMKEQKLSSSELARRTGVAQPIIYRLMNANTCNPQILTIKPIADYFAVSIDQLLGFSPLIKPPILSDLAIHDINNHLQTIKITASALEDIFPTLEHSYQQCLDAKLIKDTISKQMLPLLQLNITNLARLADEISRILQTENIMTAEPL